MEIWTQNYTESEDYYLAEKMLDRKAAFQMYNHLFIKKRQVFEK